MLLSPLLFVLLLVCYEMSSCGDGGRRKALVVVVVEDAGTAGRTTTTSTNAVVVFLRVVAFDRSALTFSAVGVVLHRISVLKYTNLLSYFSFEDSFQCRCCYSFLRSCFPCVGGQ